MVIYFNSSYNDEKRQLLTKTKSYQSTNSQQTDSSLTDDVKPWDVPKDAKVFVGLMTATFIVQQSVIAFVLANSQGQECKYDIRSFVIVQSVCLAALLSLILKAPAYCNPDFAPKTRGQKLVKVGALWLFGINIFLSFYSIFIVQPGAGDDSACAYVAPTLTAAAATSSLMGVPMYLINGVLVKFTRAMVKRRERISKSIQKYWNSLGDDQSETDYAEPFKYDLTFWSVVGFTIIQMMLLGFLLFKALMEGEAVNAFGTVFVVLHIVVSLPAFPLAATEFIHTLTDKKFARFQMSWSMTALYRCARVISWSLLLMGVLSLTTLRPSNTPYLFSAVMVGITCSWYFLGLLSFTVKLLHDCVMGNYSPEDIYI